MKGAAPLSDCWNGFCVAGGCDGVRHVDATGYTWDEPRGSTCNPETGRYELADPEA
ncbi:hypothetical protein [Amycolatopsis sp. NPDC051903]|uniref:hypothetical protein n=1 Tax=Amycolatopsis sp. NPDC051903 TaxID=3363936 RepID=UPI0037B94BE7